MKNLSEIVKLIKLSQSADPEISDMWKDDATTPASENDTPDIELNSGETIKINDADNTSVKEVRQNISKIKNNISDMQSALLKLGSQLSADKDGFVKYLFNQFIRFDQRNVDYFIKAFLSVGSPGSANKPDGIWMNKTDEAVKASADLSLALANFVKSNNIQIDFQSIYTELSVVKKSYLEIKDKQATAAKITSLLSSLSTQYDSLKKLTATDSFKSIISEDKPLFKHTKELDRSGNYFDLLKSDEPFTVKSKDGSKDVEVKINDLTDLNRLKMYLTLNKNTLGYDPDNVNDVALFLNQLDLIVAGFKQVGF